MTHVCLYLFLGSLRPAFDPKAPDVQEYLGPFRNPDLDRLLEGRSQEPVDHVGRQGGRPGGKEATIQHPSSARHGDPPVDDRADDPASQPVGSKGVGGVEDTLEEKETHVPAERLSSLRGDLARIAATDSNRIRRRAAQRVLRDSDWLESPHRLEPAPYVAVASLLSTLIVTSGGGNPLLGLFGGILCVLICVTFVNRFHPGARMRSKDDTDAHDQLGS
ncbi:MAG: hypothetical protein WC654_00100 [Patescibacteria group bacterium]